MTPMQSPNLASPLVNRLPGAMDGPRSAAAGGVPTIVAAWTLGVWLTCLLAGLCGILVPYPRERILVKEPPPIVAETLQAQLAPDEPAQAEPTPAETPEIPPPPPEPAAPPPEAPSLPPVALPTPEIALAVPVEGPTQTVAPALARPMPPAPAHPAAPAAHPGPPSSSPPHAAAASGVRHLTFGVGEGAQPSPDYPSAAVNAGEQGSVGVRFTVDEAGRVVSAELQSPSRWPLLNESALHAIRERWHFAPGPRRQFDVVIQFQLNQQ